MGSKTGIAWTDHTFNSHMGCQRISPACGGAKGVGGCYAEALVTGRMGYNATSADPRRRLTLWGPPSASTRVRTSAANWRNPPAWDAAAKRDGVRRRVFCASLADVFEDHPDLPAVRADLWPLVERCDGLDWQLLTKRPENIARMVPPAWLKDWPEHVWIGTTVEDRKRADERIEHLRAIPAALRFLSVEPLLEDHGELDLRDIGWVIVGGESGPGARPFDLAWARSIVAQCRDAGVACFVKQMGDNPVETVRVCPQHPDDVGCGDHCKLHRFVTEPVKFHAHAGQNSDEWPEDLQVQEFPEVSRGR